MSTQNHIVGRIGILVTIFAIAATITTGCDKASAPFRKSPGEVVRAFYLAANAGKYSEAEEMLNSEYKQAVSGFLGQMAGGFKGICDKISKNGSISAVDIVSEEVRGEGATVVVNIRFKDGTTNQNDRNQLVLQNGKWLLTTGK